MPELRSPADLFAQSVGHPVLIQVHGSLVTPDAAFGEMLWTHSWLGHNRSITPDTVVVEFDWPSQRVYRNDVKDINEKGRRAYVAAYHLARFVQAFPPGSRLCLLGQSYGGRVVPSALHLLGGGALNSQDRDPDVRLACRRADTHIRAVVLEGASDHDWLNPGRRLDRALPACEAFPQPLQPARPGPPLLSGPPAERAPSRPRPPGPDELRFRAARAAGGALSGAGHPRHPRQRALAARLRLEYPDLALDLLLCLGPRPRPPPREARGEPAAGIGQRLALQLRRLRPLRRAGKALITSPPRGGRRSRRTGGRSGRRASRRGRGGRPSRRRRSRRGRPPG